MDLNEYHWKFHSTINFSFSRSILYFGRVIQWANALHSTLEGSRMKPHWELRQASCSNLVLRFMEASSSKLINAVINIGWGRLFPRKRLEVGFNPFLPNVPFWSPWKHQKTFGFRMFSGGSKGNIGKKRVKYMLKIPTTSCVNSEIWSSNCFSLQCYCIVTYYFYGKTLIHRLVV